jgi:hypothetical protein
MITLYLICFVLGLVLTLLAAFSGLGHVHIGHLHFHTHLHAKPAAHVSAFNGFTLPAFLCWFGAAGYLLDRYSSMLSPLILLASVAAGLLGASVLYIALFKVLLPRERVLLPEDTRMEGTLARVSGAIRSADATGEILFTQTGARRASAARSEDGAPIPRGTEVVVLRYERGIAYIRPLHELSN